MLLQSLYNFVLLFLSASSLLAQNPEHQRFLLELLFVASEHIMNQYLSQEHLSEVVGIDSKHLSRIENGRYYPSLETLEKIIEALNVSYEDFFKFNHLVSKHELLAKITQRLETLPEDKLKLILKITNEL